MAMAKIATNVRKKVTTKVKTRAYDTANYLRDEQDMAAYLEAALMGGDAAVIAAALGDIARARGMTQLARDTGLGRESLYKALSPGGNPEFSNALKIQLHASAA
jgi:probable addiction module antidote protein